MHSSDQLPICIQAWFSLVYKTKEATQSLLSCLSIGYGQLAHAILSLWFALLAIPSWLLSTLLPLLLGGGAIAVTVAASAVLLGSSSSLGCAGAVASVGHFRTNKTLKHCKLHLYC